MIDVPLCKHEYLGKQYTVESANYDKTFRTDS